MSIKNPITREIFKVAFSTIMFGLGMYAPWLGLVFLYKIFPKSHEYLSGIVDLSIGIGIFFVIAVAFSLLHDIDFILRKGQA